MTDRTTWIPEGVADNVPSAARMYDYLLGGGHNFAVDREMVDKLNAVAPVVGQLARRNRAFLRRAVLTLVERGVRQFLDIGSGIPTVGNVHEIAQQVDPQARVVYVDNEPVAISHSELVLEDNDRATAILADMRDPASILEHPKTRQLLDFDTPIGLLMVTVFHYVADTDDPLELMARYREPLVPGSYLAMSHVCTDFNSADLSSIVAVMKDSPNPIHPRTRAAITDLFTGFDLLEPGLVPPAQWRSGSARDLSEDPVLAGVGIRRG
ncbi:MAG TPA: SAM-dependent methyltransferase [Pseudonocardiaceae bacterium]|nr:SAM-dependent methyltransferase [Pseudonocardiaceae bacterium]